MRLLLDSHAFVWAKSAPEHLTEESRAAIIDQRNEVFVSVASAWELWIKHARKPLTGIAPALDAGATGFLKCAQESGIAVLDITLGHAARAAVLPPLHRDPFDRLMIAQALIEHLVVVTRDPVFRRYKGLRVLDA
jgi:PIN domain nuclease of toxin-antitoxin system